MSKTKEYAVIFLLGGVIYSAVEVVTRGFTHWSMTIAGGICLMIIYHHFLTHPDDGILSHCLFGMITITSVEFIFGVIFNLILGWNIWDYSNMSLIQCGVVPDKRSCRYDMRSRPQQDRHSSRYRTELLMKEVSSSAISLCSGIRG